MRCVWTADFQEFKKKVENILGDITILAKRYPNLYTHLLLAHGFMEYAGIKKIFSRSDEYLREEYYRWARKNNLEERLLEAGWQEFLED